MIHRLLVVAAVSLTLPGWRLSPPPDDLAAFAKQQKMQTNVVQGDFDDDGVRDTAVLLLAPADGKSVQYIAVCLARKAGPELLLIRDPYCGDGIDVSPKGAKSYDFQASREITYPADGVNAMCFEKASGTYLYKGGRFELIVDGD